METHKVMRIGVLTSSRADYGIYKPLLKALHDDDSFELNIIAFGTHLSSFHGYTLDNIIADGYNVKYRVNSLLVNDDKNAIATACALTSLKFADFWDMHNDNFDLVFCLGDRYEMFGAVTAGIPYHVKFAHIHGGETTLGAIDNIYRHGITLSSELHFVTHESFAERVRNITGKNENIYITGSLSLDNLNTIQLLDKNEFKQKWDIDLNIPTILVTIHPETVQPELNVKHLSQVIEALRFLSNYEQIVITMPNADTNGNVFRQGFIKLKSELGEVLKLIENFGTQSYFTCMKFAKMLIGNTSSGIIEAASFKRYVIDLGDRQKGRLTGENVIHIPFNREEIIASYKKIKVLNEYTGENPYYKYGAADIIVNTLKSEYLGKL